MSAFRDICPHCGTEFTNYHDVIAYRKFCSVGCEVDDIMDVRCECGHWPANHHKLLEPGHCIFCLCSEYTPNTESEKP